MAPWELHEKIPSLDIKNIPRCLNHFSPDWWDDCTKFDGDPSLVITNVVKLLKYTLEINVIRENFLIRLFTISRRKKKKE